ncbi:MAG: hypothetical protein PVS3B1_37670 [Ktedonobacteraceae bacterium]
MQAEEILAQVKAGTGKNGWAVFPLLRDKILWAMAGWAFGILLGALLLFVITPVVVPYNYQRGLLPIIFTTALLGVLIAVVVGSAALLIVDIRRLLHANDHMIVITYEDFVKQEGDKIIQVPLTHVRHVTPRGRSPLEQSAMAKEEEQGRGGRGVDGNIFSSLSGRGRLSTDARLRRRRMRAPISLAFLDARDDTEVIVVSDEYFGDPFAIAAVLKQYAASVALVERSEI